MNPERWGRITQAVQAPRKSHLRIAIAAIVLAAIFSVIDGWYWMNRQPPVEPETEMTAVPSTSYPGSETNPCFSPDGTTTLLRLNVTVLDLFGAHVFGRPDEHSGPRAALLAD